MGDVKSLGADCVEKKMNKINGINKFTTNIDLNKLSKVVLFCEEKLNASLGGRMSAWLNKKNKAS